MFLWAAAAAFRRQSLGTTARIGVQTIASVCPQDPPKEASAYDGNQSIPIAMRMKASPTHWLLCTGYRSLQSRDVGNSTSAVGNYPHKTAKRLTPSDGVMRRGLMIRHLVLPNHTDDSVRIIDWIATHLPHDTYVNIMAQYNPHYKAYDFPELARRLTRDEYRRVVRHARERGLANLDTRASWGE